MAADVAPFGDLARRARTAAYRLASPVEAALRRLTGGRRLPPLWLRRHTGRVGAFESAARETAAWLERLDLFAGCRHVLDVGCGAGAMVEEILGRLPPDGRYVGFDVHAPSIRWCRRRYRNGRAPASSSRPWPRPTARRGRGAVELSLPRRRRRGRPGAGEVASSRIYSRRTPATTSAETRRVLRPGRPAVVTAFLFESAAGRAEVFSARGSRRRSRRRSHPVAARPEAAVAWPRTFSSDDRGMPGCMCSGIRRAIYPGRPTLDRTGRAPARRLTGAGSTESRLKPDGSRGSPDRRLPARPLAGSRVVRRGLALQARPRPGPRAGEEESLLLLEHEPVYTLGSNASRRRRSPLARAVSRARHRPSASRTAAARSRTTAPDSSSAIRS